MSTMSPINKQHRIINAQLHFRNCDKHDKLSGWQIPAIKAQIKALSSSVPSIDQHVVKNSYKRLNRSGSIEPFYWKVYALSVVSL